MDTLSLLLYGSGLVILLIGSSFFSGSETALTALTKTQVHRLREEKKSSSRAVIHFLDEPRRLFITVLFGNTLVNMAFVSITGALIYNNLFRGRSPGQAYIVAILIQTICLLLFGEMTPKTYAIKHSERLSRAVARPLWIFSTLIYPFRRMLRFITDFMLPLFGVRSLVDKSPLTSEEIRAVVKTTEEHGALDAEEGEIIHNIFELHDINVKEIMVPRTEIKGVEVSKTIGEAFRLTKKAGHSRLPVYRKRIDNICGIFYVKDLPRWKRLKLDSHVGRSIEDLTIDEFLAQGELLKTLNPENVDTLVRAPHFVYQTKKIGVLMRDLRRAKQQMAVLLDEYGGVLGLITVEDIVEEVLGEIFDEYDAVSELTIRRDPDDPSSLLIPGFVSLRSVNRSLKLNLDPSAADTIGGYVISRLGAIPKPGDVVSEKKIGLEFQVLKMDGMRVDLVRIRRREPKKARKSKTLKSFFPLMLMLCLATMGASAGSDVTQESGFLLFAYGLLLILALLLGAFYNGSETAVVSASQARIDVLANRGNRRAEAIKKLWQEPDKMLGIVLVGTNLMATAAGVAGLRLTGYMLPGREGLQVLVNTIAMTFLILVFCEILPKTIFRAKADALALRSAPGLWISALVLHPVVKALTRITNFVVRIAGREEAEEKARIMREELKLLAKMGEKEGALKREQLRMIHSVLDLESLTLEKVMTPLVDVVALPKETSIEEFYRVVSEKGYSRIPVYEERVDNIIGLVNILDVLYAESPSATIKPFIRRDIRYEPYSRHVFTLLRELKQSRRPMVFVVDEYGGIVGLITIEDLIEEILGDIRDEKDRDVAEDVHRISDTIIECDGKAEVAWLNYHYGTTIPLGDYKTVAGYVIFLMERIPKQGEQIETETMKIAVLSADSRSVRRIRLQRK